MSYREEESRKLRDILVRNLNGAHSKSALFTAELNITKHLDMGHLLETDYVYLMGVIKGARLRGTTD